MSEMTVNQMNIAIPDETVTGIGAYGGQFQLRGVNFSILLDDKTIKRIVAIQEAENLRKED